MKLKGFLIGLGFVSFFILLFLKAVKRTYDLGISQNAYALLITLCVISIVVGILTILSPLVTEFFQKKKKITK